MAKGVVYFVGVGVHIKVGHTVDLTARMDAFATNNPHKPVLIATFHGDRGSERAIHKTLAPYRVRGEWFWDCWEVRRIIERGLLGEFEAIVNEIPPRLEPRDDVLWAADALRQISGNRRPDETSKEMIERVGNAAGMKFSRAFEIWYRRARRIESAERGRIEELLGSVKNGSLESA